MLCIIWYCWLFILAWYRFSLSLSVCMSVYLSIYLSIYLSMYLSVCLSVCLSVVCLPNLPTYLSNLPTYLPTYLPTLLPTYLPTYLSISLSSVCLLNCLSVYLSLRYTHTYALTFQFCKVVMATEMMCEYCCRVLDIATFLIVIFIVCVAMPCNCCQDAVCCECWRQLQLSFGYELFVFVALFPCRGGSCAGVTVAETASSADAHPIHFMVCADAV
jgi:hypothetical protein